MAWLGDYIKIKDIIAFAAIVTFIMLGNINNVWHCMTPRQFAKKALAPTNNGFVMGRMAMNNQQGFAAQSGFLTHVQPHVFPRDLPPIEAEEFRLKRWIYGYRAYVDNFEITYNQPYITKTAYNAHVYTLFERVFGFSPVFNLQFIVWQKSFLFAAIIAFIVILFSKLTNKLAGIFIAIAFIFNPYINLFSVALYWVPWTFFFPFALASWLLYKDYKGKIKFGKRHYVLLMLAMFVHMIFHSFEFLPTTGIMAVTPFVLFGILKKYSIVRIIKNLAIASTFYLIAIFAGIGLVMAQQTNHFGSWSGTWDHFVFSLSTRTNANIKVNKSQAVYERLKASSEFPLSYTYNLYLQKEALQIVLPRIGKIVLTFEHLLLLGILCSLILLYHHFSFLKKQSDTSNLSLGVVTACWFSFLAPLFWLTVFRGHSNFHPHVNPIILFMPFMILLMTLIACGFSLIPKLIFK